MIEQLLQAERALAVGLVDQAEALYRQAVARDSRNGIAVVGLARVALERGDEPRALELARQALEIDPENAAAQRLEARLVEVMAFRGFPPNTAGPGSTSAVVVAAAPTADPSAEAPPPGPAADEPPSADAMPTDAMPAGVSAQSAPEVPPAGPAAHPRRRLIDRLLRRGR